MGYAQTAAVGIVLLTGSTMYTELSGRSRTSKFWSSCWSILWCPFLAFRCQGRLMDLCMTKHAAFEGSASQTWETYHFLLTRSLHFSKSYQFYEPEGFACGWTWEVDHPKSSSIVQQVALLAQALQTLGRVVFGRGPGGDTAAGAQQPLGNR